MTYIIYILAGVFCLLGFFGFFYSGPKKFWVTLASCIYMAAGIISFQTLSFLPLLIGFSLNMFLKLSGLEPTDTEVDLASINNNEIKNNKTNEKTTILTNEIKTKFLSAANIKNETLSEYELNNITIKMLKVYEISGQDFFNEHLSYEVQKYINEGLREDYKF